jgi:hypothetical protein
MTYFENLRSLLAFRDVGRWMRVAFGPQEVLGVFVLGAAVAVPEIVVAAGGLVGVVEADAGKSDSS